MSLTVAAATVTTVAKILSSDDYDDLAQIREDAIRRVDNMKRLMKGPMTTVAKHALQQHLTVIEGVLCTHRRLPGEARGDDGTVDTDVML